MEMGWDSLHDWNAVVDGLFFSGEMDR